MEQSQISSCILVVQSDRARTVQIMTMLSAARPNDRTRHAMDLTEAYNLSETMQPDLVLLDEAHTRLSGLPMFLSLLSALAIDWVVIAQNEGRLAKIPDRRQASLSELPRFLKHDWGPRAALRHQLIKRPATPPLPKRPKAPTITHPDRPSNTVVIGASTGGIEGLIHILSNYPPKAPPTVIVQHINPVFLPGLADRLDRLCASRVRPAEHDDLLQPGLVLLAPGDTRHLHISDTGHRCQFVSGAPRNGHRPSVDMLFSSAAAALGPRCVGVLLSGMGRDGAAGLLDIRAKGGFTIAQDEDTSIVYGMPRAAADCGAVQEQLPISKISNAVLKAAATSRRTPHDA